MRTSSENPAPVSASDDSTPVRKAVPEARLSARLWQRFVLGVFIGASGLLQRLPRRHALRFGRDLGRLAFRVDGKRRGYARRNLRLAYGDLITVAERDRMTRQSFEHWGKSTVDFLCGPALTREQRDRLVSRVEGREWLESLRAEGTGFLVITGHIGNFELLGRWMADQGVPSTVVVRQPSNPAFAEYLREMREYGGNEALNRGVSPRELISRLRKGRVITLGIDQNSADIFVPFFGVPAGTVTGPAVLGLRTGSKLLPTFCVREPDDSYCVIFEEPIDVTASGDRNADVERVTTEANAALEQVVRRYPEQWLWLHNRWKSAFEEKNRERWPTGYDYDEIHARWV